VGIFGGTFDPPHVGHLLAAGDAVERLGLDVVLWVPVGTQPLKPGGPEAAGEPRLRMVELTVEGDSRFAAESWEVRRSGLSFTVDTLEEIRRRDPDAELFLLLGEDSWRSFPRWREPGRIREIATVAVLARAGGENRSAADHADNAADGDEPIRLETRRVDVSATEVRERVREGLSIHGFVSDAVERYITEQKLYR
jgi:nicotinate-nucleotide adenylyltransferase